jgi:hypothetical protein
VVVIFGGLWGLCAEAYGTTAKLAVAAFRNVLRVGANTVLPLKVYFRKRLVTLALMFWLRGRRLGPIVAYWRGRCGQLRRAIQREREHNRRVVHLRVIRGHGSSRTA